MASIRSILGVIEGSAGGITFAQRGGLNVLRQKVGSNSSNTPAQQLQRAKFGAIGRLAKNLGAVLLAGYKTVGGATPYNRFVGENIAFADADDNYVASIDYSRVAISTGSVTPLTGLTVANSTNGKTISWSDNSDANRALASDKVYLALVNTATMEVAESLGAKTRADGSLEVPAPWLVGLAASSLAVYAFARRADGSDASMTAIVATASTSTGGTTTTTTYTLNLKGPSESGGGVTLTATAGDEFSFNELTTGGSAPASMDIYLGGAQVATVDYTDRYAGKPFRFTHAGVAHMGSFAAGTVNL